MKQDKPIGRVIRPSAPLIQSWLHTPLPDAELDVLYRESRKKASNLLIKHYSLLDDRKRKYFLYEIILNECDQNDPLRCIAYPPLSHYQLKEYLYKFYLEMAECPACDNETDDKYAPCCSLDCWNATFEPQDKATP